MVPVAEEAQPILGEQTRRAGNVLLAEADVKPPFLNAAFHGEPETRGCFAGERNRPRLGQMFDGRVAFREDDVADDGHRLQPPAYAKRAFAVRLAAGQETPADIRDYKGEGGAVLRGIVRGIGGIRERERVALRIGGQFRNGLGGFRQVADQFGVVAGAQFGEHFGITLAEGGHGYAPGRVRDGDAGGAGGGRIAVRLTNAGTAFSDYWKTNVTAYGESFGGGNDKASSAGTVYLQTAADGEAGGLVVVRNDLAVQAAAANNNATTRYPGNGDGCDALAALKKASLLVAGAAHVELTDSMKAAALEIESGSTIDLAGTTFTVRSATIGGIKLRPGTYAAGSDAVSGFVTNSGEGGNLVVTGGGFKIMVR